MSESVRTVGSLFSGYMGLDSAVSTAFGGLETVFVCDNDAGPARLLEVRTPDTPNLGDITRVNWNDVPHVDVLCGGSPCPDLSAAGVKRGMSEDTRSGLWFSMLQGVRTLKPKFVVWENVFGALSAKASSDISWQSSLVDERTAQQKPAKETGRVLRALGRVLGDLSECGYDAVWEVLSASEVGACHLRKRVFVLAWRRDLGASALPDLDLADVPWSLAEFLGSQSSTCKPVGEAVQIASWDAERDCWMDDRERSPRRKKLGLFESWGIYADPYPHRGLSSDGVLFSLPVVKAALPDVLDGNLLPTVRSQDVNSTPGAPGANRHVLKGMGSLGEVLGALLLPTPDAYSAVRGGGTDPQKRRAGGHSVSLQDALSKLLPTPSATDYQCRGTLDPSKRQANNHQVRLGDALAAETSLLPTPMATDSFGSAPSEAERRSPRLGAALILGLASNLPTPVVSDSESGETVGENQAPPRLNTGLLNELLPTPKASDAAIGRGTTTGRSKKKATLLSTRLVYDMPADNIHFGVYETRVRLAEMITGVSSPPPLIRTRTGGWKLNPQFQEWMMMIPPGWITDPILWEKSSKEAEEVREGTRNPKGRAQALMLGGNGVVPLQGLVGLLRLFALARVYAK